MVCAYDCGYCRARGWFNGASEHLYVRRFAAKTGRHVNAHLNRRTDELVTNETSGFVLSTAGGFPSGNIVYFVIDERAASTHARTSLAGRLADRRPPSKTRLPRIDPLMSRAPSCFIAGCNRSDRRVGVLQQQQQQQHYHQQYSSGTKFTIRSGK
jgi:hypothetical protein